MKPMFLILYDVKANPKVRTSERTIKHALACLMIRSSRCVQGGKCLPGLTRRIRVADATWWSLSGSNR